MEDQQQQTVVPSDTKEQNKTESEEIRKEVETLNSTNGISEIHDTPIPTNNHLNHMNSKENDCAFLSIR